MKLLIGDPALFTADIIMNLLLSYRDIQVGNICSGQYHSLVDAVLTSGFVHMY